MRKVVCLLMGFLVLQGCSREYVQETIHVYNQEGVTLGFRVRPKFGFIYTAGPFIDFIAENQSGKEYSVIEARRKIADDERTYYSGDMYTNDVLRDAENTYPVLMPNNSRFESMGTLPDPSTFQPGKVPVYIRVRFQIDGVDMEVEKNIEITVK